MSDPPVQGPEIELDQNTLFGLDRHPVLPDTIR